MNASRSNSFNVSEKFGSGGVGKPISIEILRRHSGVEMEDKLIVVVCGRSGLYNITLTRTVRNPRRRLYAVFGIGKGQQYMQSRSLLMAEVVVVGISGKSTTIGC